MFWLGNIQALFLSLNYIVQWYTYYFFFYKFFTLHILNPKCPSHLFYISSVIIELLAFGKLEMVKQNIQGDWTQIRLFTPTFNE